jgi:uncharacterized DUF497 family protein
MADRKQTGKGFEEYEGFLDPQPGDVGDERDVFDFANYQQFIDKNERKHHILTSEIEECFSNKPKSRFEEEGYTEGEDVYRALGRTDAGRYIAVIHILKLDGSIMPLSAHDMKTWEKNLYERK